MPRYMRDSTNARDIPRIPGDMVAGYDDGIYAWSAADWAYHSEASRQVHISVLGRSLSAHVIDIEEGTVTPAQGARWLAQKKNRGEIGAAYFSRSLFGAVNAEVTKLGLGPSDWTVWAAEWTGQPHIVPGTYATQYDHPPHSGGHFDVSLVADYWPGIDPVPPPGGGSGGGVVTPPPPVTPPPTSGGGTGSVNAVRDSWAHLADVLVNGVKGAVDAVEAIVEAYRSL